MKEYFILNNTGDVSVQTLWKASKAVARGHFLSLATSKKKCNDILIKDLTKQIDFLSTLHKRTCSPKIYAQLLSERKKKT